MELRPYQTDAKNAVIKEWNSGNQKTLLVLPTGCGKTVVFSKIAEDCVRNGDRVLMLAHRNELLNQAADKLMSATGLGCSLEKAESTCIGEWFRVVVGSVQTLKSQKRLARFNKNYFDTIIIDEAHHAISNSYLSVLEYFDNAKVLGVTATPDRGDMKNLGSVFDTLAYEYSLPQAIKEGFLCKIKAITMPLKIDISSISMQSGDFKASEVDLTLEPYLEKIADEMITYCSDRKTVVFLPLVKTSQTFRDILNKKGFKCAEINGSSQDREQILNDFDDDKYNVLCNSMLLTEGWDCPSVDCVIVLRPTKSRSLYSQMVGRGTRLFEGKEDLLLLDFLWHTEKHELCRPAHLICENIEVAKTMTQNLEKDVGTAVDIIEAEEIATSDTLIKREESLAKKLEEMRRRKKKLVDPIQYELSIGAEDLSSYVPSFGWEMSPPTESQLKALENLGINAEEIGNSGKAKLMLDKLEKRREIGLSTPKQIRILEQKGFKHVGSWSFESASKMIARISANGWRVPNSIDVAEYTPSK